MKGKISILPNESTRISEISYKKCISVFDWTYRKITVFSTHVSTNIWAVEKIR